MGCIVALIVFYFSPVLWDGICVILIPMILIVGILEYGMDCFYT